MQQDQQVTYVTDASFAKLAFEHINERSTLTLTEQKKQCLLSFPSLPRSTKNVVIWTP